MITDDVTQPLPAVAVSGVCDPVVRLAAADPGRAVTRVTLPVDGGSGAR